MNRPMIAATSLIILSFIASVSHAANEEYSANIKSLERFFGDGKRVVKLYSGKRKPNAGLAQILVLSGLSITRVDDRRVKSKRSYFGYRAYAHLPGIYELEVTSWKRKRNREYTIGSISNSTNFTEHATYTLQVVLEPGLKYVLSPIWNDDEMAMISPRQVCLQGQSEDARYCAVRPSENNDVVAMDERHGLIVVGLTLPPGITEKIIMMNLDCEWNPRHPHLRVLDKRATKSKLKDVCEVAVETTNSRGYTVESVDAGVWKWWGFAASTFSSAKPMIQTFTFDVEPGKVNYVGHVHVRLNFETGRLVGLSLTDNFSSFESIIRSGFGDSEIVNKATQYAGSGDLDAGNNVNDY